MIMAIGECLLDGRECWVSSSNFLRVLWMVPDWAGGSKPYTRTELQEAHKLSPSRRA